ncbi:MAG: T9SS type A sorting domain-containing protein [Prevotellaceae bacterium]|jgi:rhamnogalacturonan endolyase|nr:T9SS type A sorting domain-containing protein [Prevotellaceae bacterium]
MKRLLSSIALLVAAIFVVHGARQLEQLGRGLLAVKVSDGVYLSWRLLGSDDYHATRFNVYRNGALICELPVDAPTCYTDAEGTAAAVYSVKAIADGVGALDSTAGVTPWTEQYRYIPLQRPAGGTTPPNIVYNGSSESSITEYPNGESYTYLPNDCSVGDLDGDGEYEIIVKWDPSNSKDNSQTGITGNVYIDAYKLSGERLWRIDLGKNIRAGAHYTQFMVYDFDGDGCAEMVCKTAPGTVDGKGRHVVMSGDDSTAVYRNENIAATGSARTGFVLKGPEYLTLFDGQTGRELHTVAYKPARGTVSSWGDSYGNRVDRFLACVAYLDGERPSVVMCRGYYTRVTLTAYDVVDRKLVERWYYDSGNSIGTGNLYGQGNHNLSVADVDGDGKDEIIYGAGAIDDDGSFMYRTGLGHGDAMHLSDLDPDRPGLEVWEVHEEKTAGKYDYEMHDARTGAIIWRSDTYANDNGRGLAADVDARHRGFEMWSSSGTGIYSCKGVQLATSKPSTNFRVYWDGDLQDELLDGNKLDKWTGAGTRRLITFSPGASVNGTKANPCISADMLGDWREEVVYYSAANPDRLVLYATTIPTEHRFFTLMHDPVYRLGVAWQNVSYNQPPHLGFYLPDSIENLKSVLVSLDPQGGVFGDSASTAVRQIRVTPNKPFSHLVPEVAKDMHIFLGWYFSDESPYNPDTTLTSPATLVARWRPPCMVRFIGRDVVSWDTTVIYNTPATEPQPPSREGYVLAGWTSGGVLWDFATPITEGITLVAKWEAVKTGIADSDAPPQLDLYPNPASAAVTLTGLTGNETVDLISISGSLLLSRKATSNKETIDVSSLPAGAYLVRVTNGSTAKQLKLIKN